MLDEIATASLPHEPIESPFGRQIPTAIVQPPPERAGAPLDAAEHSPHETRRCEELTFQQFELLPIINHGFTTTIQCRHLPGEELSSKWPMLPTPIRGDAAGRIVKPAPIAMLDGIGRHISLARDTHD
jgi:hypothetical protein